MSDPHTLATRPARAVAKTVIVLALATGLGGVTVAYATDAAPPVATHSEGYAPDVRPDLPPAAPTPAPPVVLPEHAELAYSGINLAPWWVAYSAIGLVVGGVLLHLARPSRGDE